MGMGLTKKELTQLLRDQLERNVELSAQVHELREDLNEMVQRNAELIERLRERDTETGQLSEIEQAWERYIKEAERC